ECKACGLCVCGQTALRVTTLPDTGQPQKTKKEHRPRFTLSRTGDALFNLFCKWRMALRGLHREMKQKN
ncbi:MAG: hypothetical protein RSD62_03540, partial [Ruthenibacterium sp.]